MHPTSIARPTLAPSQPSSISTARPAPSTARAEPAAPRNFVAARAAAALSASAIAIASSLGGCSTPGQRIDATNTSMAETGRSLNSGAAQVDDVVTHLNALGATPDLRTTFKDYCDSLALLEKDAKRVRDRWATLKARADEYERNWERELEKIEGEEARTISEARRETFRNRLAGLRDAMESLKDSYDPFVTELSDVRVLLANDLTRGGIASIEPLRDRANDLARQLRERLSDTRRALVAAEAEYTTNVRAATAGDVER